MLSQARDRIQRVTGPIGTALVRTGLTPDAMTLIGTTGVVLSSIFLVVPGHVLAGGLAITFFALTDMLDGAMARARGWSSRWGAFLDSTCDRLADASIFAAAAYWLFREDRDSAGVAALLCLITGVLVSYAKARAEGLGLTANVGIAERTERLVLVGVGGVLEVLGVPGGIEWILWLLTALAAFTVGQRVHAVWTQTKDDRVRPDRRLDTGPVPPPTGYPGPAPDLAPGAPAPSAEPAADAGRETA
ncbi:phosphatidylinositol phosphate synthase [Cryptosporangium japonicum]|uniref:Phosphatidylinositol phosphate synthase n=1 Tax=Cryptosporangium japonicum TaxID=80872 RepID=A0ABP3ESW3_9ACTN